MAQCKTHKYANDKGVMLPKVCHILIKQKEIVWTNRYLINHEGVRNAVNHRSVRKDINLKNLVIWKMICQKCRLDFKLLG